MSPKCPGQLVKDIDILPSYEGKPTRELHFPSSKENNVHMSPITKFLLKAYRHHLIVSTFLAPINKANWKSKMN